MIDIKGIKIDFPILQNHPDLVYLDNAATSQKPQVVLDAMNNYYQNKNANVHRGIYKLSEEATNAYEASREKVRSFINAKSTREIIFTSGTTESINLVAYSFKQPTTNNQQQLKVLLSQAEHHSNIVPWQVTGYHRSAGSRLWGSLLVTRYSDDHRLDLEDYKKKLEQGIDLVAITHASNVLGTINPIREITRLAHDAGASVLVDGAQAVPHLNIDVQDLDADFYAFSGHKMFGPTGIGVLYSKETLLKEMSPFLGGGEMIKRVSFEKSAYNELPWKFEAGTPNIAGAIGLGAAVDYMNSVRLHSIREHEQELGEYAIKQLTSISGLTLHGPSTMRDRVGAFSFSLNGIHPHDLAQVLDEDDIAIRAGHHCCMPLHEKVLKQTATARASIYMYNTKEDIDRLVEGIEKAKKLLK